MRPRKIQRTPSTANASSRNGSGPRPDPEPTPRQLRIGRAVHKRMHRGEPAEAIIRRYPAAGRNMQRYWEHIGPLRRRRS